LFGPKKIFLFRATVLKTLGRVGSVFFNNWNLNYKDTNVKNPGIFVNKVYGLPLPIGRVGLPETQDYFLGLKALHQWAPWSIQLSLNSSRFLEQSVKADGVGHSSDSPVRSHHHHDRPYRHQRPRSPHVINVKTRDQQPGGISFHHSNCFS